VKAVFPIHPSSDKDSTCCGRLLFQQLPAPLEDFAPKHIPHRASRYRDSAYLDILLIGLEKNRIMKFEIRKLAGFELGH
jgi:hypothetical protein